MALTSVRVQLNWKPQFEFAAFYMASTKGYYRQEGLDVKILPGGPGMRKSVTKIIRDGEAEFGVEYSGVLVDALENGGLQVMGALFEHSPQLLLYKNAPGDAIDDLDGFDIYLNPNESGRTALSLLLRNSGISYREHPFDIEAYRHNDRAAIGLFGSNRYFYEEIRKGTKEVAWIDPAAYGYDFYDDFIVASKKFWQDHPLLARRFVLATLKGWRYAMAHIQETATYLDGLGICAANADELVFEGRHLKKYVTVSPQMVGLLRMRKLELMLQRFISAGDGLEKKRLEEVIDPLFLYHQGTIRPQEREWMAHHVVRYSETWWPPFSIPRRDRSGLDGVVPDYMRLIYRRTGLLMRYEPKKRWSDILEDIRAKRLDMAIATAITPGRKRYAIFSLPYGTYPHGLVVKAGETRRFDPRHADRWRIAVGKDYTAQVMLALYYPKVELVPVANTGVGLEKLVAGEVDGVVDILPTLKYIVTHEHYPQFRFSTPFKHPFVLRAMMRDDYEMGMGIFNKGLSAIHPDEKAEIENRWLPVELHRSTEPYRAPFLLALGIVTFLAFSILWMRREMRLRKRTEEELRHMLEVVDRNVLMSKTDRKGIVTYISSALEKLSGFSEEELIGKSYHDLFDRDIDPSLVEQMEARLSEGEVWQVSKLKATKRDGEVYWVDVTVAPVTNGKGEIKEYMTIRRDVTPYVRLEELVMVDPMTGFYNRRAFNEMMPRLLANAHRRGEPILFGIFDVDNFRNYNSIYGHMAGDEALVGICESVRNRLKRGDDIFFRLGGEEFGIVIGYLHNLTEAHRIAQELVQGVEALKIPHTGNPPHRVVTISLGMVLCRHVEEGQTMMRHLYRSADRTMYRAKALGRNRACVKEIASCEREEGEEICP